MKTGITTHVLDLVQGLPGSNILVELWQYKDLERLLLSSANTNADGRVEQPLLDELIPGEFELVFHLKDYWQCTKTANVLFETVPIRFIVKEGETHYHIPLLLSAWGYQTYRGS
ncbi:hydroxyisourate hydrolase [Niallia taxi]|uniref:5-hydroxyisourate hydrolase n=1 Tax=Niallia taxi TaxID=2499688 RepID=A0A437K4X8_9BACI|nr:hydroxyisourate hydrolase [Niallia taxi]MCM3214339.1 hydroxyisourate hydrolase [Niallia taxi]MDK8641119.1 hydroxyisourate hydrolase [Niallia taxi]MED4038192.1 hydroxyisourate hydrolase [Niallia taxi]MED4052622.1 hydroxyisourate hydrolase [Niallia taxi]MED4119977.1 hydroxyisourate hydrolase [Niallia taxi]